MNFKDEWNILPLPKNKKFAPPLKWEQTIYPREKLKGHDGNYALATGKASGNLVVIDFDFRNGKKKGIKTIVGLMPPTLIAETPHGYHFFYTYDGFEPRNTSSKNVGYTKKSFISKNTTRFAEYLNGIDTRGEGGYVVCPPSIIDGFMYEWHNDLPIRKLNEQTYETLINSMELPEADKSKNTIRKGFVDILLGKNDPNDYCNETGLDEHVYWKEMFHECYSVAKLEPEELFEGLKKYQKGFDVEKTQQQLNNQEVITYIKNGKRLSKNKYKEYFPDKNPIFGFDFGNDKIYVQSRLPEHLLNPFLETITIKTPKEYSKSFLIYEDGIWVEEPEIVIESKLYDFFRKCFYTVKKDDKEVECCVIESKGITNLANTVLKLIRTKTLCSIEDFNIHNSRMPVGNGILNFKDLNNIYIEPYSPKHLFTHKLSAIYDPSVEAPCIDKFVGQMLSSPTKSKERTIDDKVLLLQHVGEILLANPSIYSKTPLLVGSTRSGKTTFMEVLRQLIGPKYTMMRSLQEFQDNKYAISDLEHKLLNFYPDLPSEKYLYEIDKIKILTDPILSGDKKWESYRIFSNTCKQFHGCNKLPKLKTESKALEKRFSIIECGVNYKKKDPYLLQKLTTKKELSGLLNLAIMGLKLLITKGEHINQDIGELWDKKSNSVQYFLDNYCSDKDEGHKLLLDDLLVELNKFLNDQDLDTISDNKWLGKELKKLEIPTQRNIFAGVKKSCIIGYTINI